MNKTELVAAMAKETNLSKKDVEAVLKSFIDVVSEDEDEYTDYRYPRFRGF